MNFTLLLLLAMVAWGVSWPIAKLTTQNTAPEILIFWRNLATSIALLPVLFFFKNHLVLSREGIIRVLWGALFMSAYNYLFFAGLRDGLAGLGGVIVTSVNPLLNYFILILFGWHRVSKNEIIGLGLGFLGGLLLLRIWEVDIELLLKGGNLFFLIASLFWAILTIISSRSKEYLHPFVYSFYVYVFSTIITLPIAYSGDFTSVLQNDIYFWLGIFYLSAVSTGFGTTVYFISSFKLGSGKASSFIFLVPGTAILSAWVMMGEKPSITTVMGGAIAMIAVKIIQSDPIKTEEEIIEPL